MQIYKLFHALSKSLYTFYPRLFLSLISIP